MYQGTLHLDPAARRAYLKFNHTDGTVAFVVLTVSGGCDGAGFDSAYELCKGKGEGAAVIVKGSVGVCGVAAVIHAASIV
jgi:hypothetical protein